MFVTIYIYICIYIYREIFLVSYGIYINFVPGAKVLSIGLWLGLALSKKYFSYVKIMGSIDFPLFSLQPKLVVQLFFIVIFHDFFYLSIYLSMYLSIYLSIQLSIFPSIYLSTYLSIYLFVSIFIYLYLSLPITTYHHHYL